MSVTVPCLKSGQGTCQDKHRSSPTEPADRVIATSRQVTAIQGSFSQTWLQAPISRENHVHVKNGD